MDSKTRHPGPRYSAILRLSRPNTMFGREYVPPPQDFQLVPKFEPLVKFKLPPNLKKVRSTGIEFLAEPQPRLKSTKFIRPETPSPPYQPVSREALKYEPTEKMLQLAKPKKQFIDPNLRLYPFEVSKKAKRPISPYLLSYLTVLATPSKRKLVKKRVMTTSSEDLV